MTNSSFPLRLAAVDLTDSPAADSPLVVDARRLAALLSVGLPAASQVRTVRRPLTARPTWAYLLGVMLAREGSHRGYTASPVMVLRCLKPAQVAVRQAIREEREKDRLVLRVVGVEWSDGGGESRTLTGFEDAIAAGPRPRRPRGPRKSWRPRVTTP